MAQEVEDVQSRSTDLPAVGVVATAQNMDAVIRTVLRATERGHLVFLTYPTDSEPEAVTLSERLGARIIHPAEDDPSTEYLRELLAATAQAESYPGLIFHSNPSSRIAYQKSTTTVQEEGFCISAITEAETAANEAPEILVGIPAYNEAGTIQNVVSHAADYADQVLVVDDGSDDQTAQLARQEGALVVEHDENSGYGAALKTVFEEAKVRNAEQLVIIDGDGQHDPSDIPELVHHQESTEADVVIGSRFGDRSETDFPLYRRLGLGIVNTLTNISMGVIRPNSRIKDTQSGFRVYNSTAIASLAEDTEIGDHMNASTDILFHAHRRGYTVDEIGTTVDYDVDEPNNHSPISHGLILVSNILRTVERERPVTTLGIPGFCVSFLGLGFGYMTFSNFLNTGTFPIGLAILSAFTALAGIFACFTAIILHSLKMHFTD